MHFKKIHANASHSKEKYGILFIIFTLIFTVRFYIVCIIIGSTSYRNRKVPFDWLWFIMVVSKNVEKLELIYTCGKD